MMFVVESNRPQLMAIFYAVYNLSPVNIITLIPALLRSTITSGTSYWSLSYTPLAPSS